MRLNFKKGYLKNKIQLKDIMKRNKQSKEDEIQKIKSLKKKEQWRKFRLEQEEKGRNMFKKKPTKKQDSID